jgi:hypothetical protein
MDNYNDIKELQKKAAVCYVFVVPMCVIGFSFLGYLIAPWFTFIGGIIGVIAATIITAIILGKY